MRIKFGGYKMIEVLKLIGSALVAAAATLFSLYLKRKWEKQDKTEDKKNAMEEKIDNLSDQLVRLTEKVDKLSSELDQEVMETGLKNRCLQAGLREMLYDRIKYLCRKYITDGKIREEEYKSLNRMWSVYHNDLEGNGYLDGEMTEIEKLEKY